MHISIVETVPVIVFDKSELILCRIILTVCLHVPAGSSSPNAGADECARQDRYCSTVISLLSDQKRLDSIFALRVRSDRDV